MWVAHVVGGVGGGCSLSVVGVPIIGGRCVLGSLFGIFVFFVVVCPLVVMSKFHKIPMV